MQSSFAPNLQFDGFVTIKVVRNGDGRWRKAARELQP